MGLSVPSTQYIVELVGLFRVSSDYLLGIETEKSVKIGNLNEDEQTIVINLVTHFNRKV